MRGFNFSLETSDDADGMNQILSFKYQLDKPGVARGLFGLNDEVVDFEVTNVSNPLLDLLKGLASMIFEPSHLWDEENMCWIDWYCEQCGIKWVLSTEDGHSLRVKIIRYEDFFDESTAAVAIDSVVNFVEFYSLIIRELDGFIKKTGLLNYEQKWQQDEFPLTYFLLLKKYLIERGQWIPTNEKLGTLSDEIDFLLA